MPAKLSGEEVHIRAGIAADMMRDVSSTLDVRGRKPQEDLCTCPFAEKRMRAQHTPDLDGWIIAKQFHGRLIKVIHAGNIRADLPGSMPRKVAEKIPVSGNIIKMTNESDHGFVADLFIKNTSAFAFYQ